MSPIRILIADDSPVMCTLYRELLSAAGDFEIVGEVADGRAAVQACQELRPQVVAMDVEMPGLNGIEATAAIMRQCPTPVVVVSHTLDSRACRLAMQAFGAGAVDVVPKPDLTDRSRGRRSLVRLADTLRTMSSVRVMRKAETRGMHPVPLHAGADKPIRVIGIGASTGGPQALKQVLADLPPDYPIPILVVQHMVPEFLDCLIEWLQTCIPLPIMLARDGMRLPGSGVVIAPGGSHLKLAGPPGRLHLDPSPEPNQYRPSVDVLFDSLAGWTLEAAGILLTGMGADGAAGLARMKAAGALTMAQDEASSVVWGMPGEAVRLGAADVITSPGELGRHLSRLAQTSPH